MRTLGTVASSCDRPTNNCSLVTIDPPITVTVMIDPHTTVVRGCYDRLTHYKMYNKTINFTLSVRHYSHTKNRMGKNVGRESVVLTVSSAPLLEKSRGCLAQVF